MNNHRQEHTRKAWGRVLITVAGALLPFAAAQAYVGPGAGLSLLGALWGLLAAIGAALLFVVLWPIRRMRRRKREAARNTAAAPETSSATGRSDGDAEKHTPGT